MDVEILDEDDGGDDIDYCEGMPDPPFTVRDKAHLEELLLEAIHSPKEPVTDQFWADIRAEVRRRYEEKHGPGSAGGL